MTFEPLLPTHILRERFEAAGVLFDCDLLKKHVDSVCRSCFDGHHDLQRIKDQRNWLCLAANALDSSRLDYCIFTISGFIQR